MRVVSWDSGQEVLKPVSLCSGTVTTANCEVGSVFYAGTVAAWRGWQAAASLGKKWKGAAASKWRRAGAGSLGWILRALTGRGKK